MSSVSESGARILAILDLFTEQRPDWTPEQMMQALGYSRPTLYRYLKTLKDAGYLISHPGQGYVLGPRVTELDFLMQRADPLITIGTPFLHMLAHRYPCSVFITRWYGRKILCIASEVSNPAPKSSYPRGRPMPLGRGAISHVLFANLPRKEQDEVLQEFHPDLPASGHEQVLAHWRDIRRDGVSVAYGEVTPGVVGVAAPILAAERMPVAALCLTSNAADMDPERLSAIRKDVRDSAAALSDALRNELRDTA